MLGYGRVSNKYRLKLPQAMRDAGYYTFGIGKMHWFPQRTLNGFHKTLVDESGRAETPGFISDYRRWFREQAPDLDPDATGIGWNDYRAGVYALPEALHPTYWTAQMAVDFIEGYNKAQPFMLKVSFARPHSPYDPPKRFMEAYNESDMPAPCVGKWAAGFAEHKDPVPYSLWHGDLGDGQAKKSRRGYYGSVSFIDEQIGRILDALKKRGMYDNTLIILFADHGDMLGDHHHWRKTYAYEGSAKIPMLLRWPGQFGYDHMRGKSLSQVVELRDVLPTFLDAAGAGIGSHLDGMSLLSLVRGQVKDWRRFIDLEHAVCYGGSTNWNALTDGSFKYIYHANTGWEQLFDMVNDPGEISDLATEVKYQSTLETWRERLIKHLAERGEAFVSGGGLTIRKSQMLYSPLFPK
jgi:arylsulfatase A-like enzyme